MMTNTEKNKHIANVADYVYGSKEMDIFSKDKRSEIMCKIGSKNTKPEIFVRRLIHSLGYRYRLHKKDLPGTPDLVFPKYKKVIFVNGCFWHGHENCSRSKIPLTNSEFWKTKIGRNMKNDIAHNIALYELGWEVLTIWECEINYKNIKALEEIITSFLRRNMGSNL